MTRYAEPGPADVLPPGTAQVAFSRREGPGVVTHDLAWPMWPGCAPGQFNMLGLPGLGEIPSSVTGGTTASGWVTHTLRAAGPVSTALVALAPGAALTIRGPFGRPWPLDADPERPVLIVAWGLGMVPLRPVVRHFARDAGRAASVRLVIGARSPNDLVSWRDYDGWRKKGIDLVLTVDQAPTAWPWHVGRVTRFLGGGAEPPDTRRLAYVCGPEAMMRSTARHLVAQGVAEDAIFLSLARPMPCGTGECGACRLGRTLLCREGPVLSWHRAAPLIDAVSG
jgi:NAD(P)H-flavin reductase